MKHVISKIWSDTYLIVLSFVGILFGSIAFAQDGEEAIGEITDSVAAFGALVNTTTIVVVGLAFLFFFYYLAIFILKSGDEGEQSKAKTRMIYAVVAIVVITSLWGVIAFVRSIVGIDAGSSEDINAIPTVRN